MWAQTARTWCCWPLLLPHGTPPWGLNAGEDDVETNTETCTGERCAERGPLGTQGSSWRPCRGGDLVRKEVRTSPAFTARSSPFSLRRDKAPGPFQLDGKMLLTLAQNRQWR